jgi:hypothetical protein
MLLGVSEGRKVGKFEGITVEKIDGSSVGISVGAKVE